MPRRTSTRFPYDVVLSNEEGWDVVDMRTFQPVRLNDLPQVGLPGGIADEIADLLNQLSRVPRKQRH